MPDKLSAMGERQENAGLVPAFVAAAFAMLLWGATPAATRFAVNEIDPVTAGILRTVLALAITVPVLFWRRFPLPRTSGEWSLLATSAGSGFIAFPLLFTHGLSLTSTSHAALILAGLPIITGLFGALFDRAMPARIWVIGMAIAFAGEVVLIGGRGGGGEATLEGDLYCLFGSVFSGLGYVTGSRLAGRIGTWSVTFWGITLAGLVLVPLLAWTSPATDWSAVTMEGWGGVVFLAVFSAIVGYVAWYWALAKGGVARIAPIQFAQPLVSLVLAVILFAEVMTLPLIVATVMILTGIAVARRG